MILKISNKLPDSSLIQLMNPVVMLPQENGLHVPILMQQPELVQHNPVVI